MRMVKFLHGAAAVIAAAGATQGMAQSPDTPSQVERWQVDGSNGMCTLIRTVAAPKEGALFLQTTPGTNVYSFAVISKGIVLHSGDLPLPASIALHDADAGFKGKATSARLENEGGTLMRIQGLDDTFVEAFARSSSVTLERGAGPIGPFAYHGADHAVHVFHACIAQRLTDWGADAVQFQPGGKQPVPLKKPDDWFSHRQLFDLIGFIDRRASNPADVTLRLTIATDGRISACQDIDDKHAYADLEKAACGVLMSQQLFEAARDPAGKPVIGVAAYRLALMSVRR